VLQKNLLLGARNKERLILWRLKQQLLLSLVLLVSKEVIVVRGEVGSLTTAHIKNRSLVCQPSIVQILHLMGSHDLRLVVRLHDVNSLRHELVGDSALVRELLVNHDHVPLLRLLHAF